MKNIHNIQNNNIPVGVIHEKKFVISERFGIHARPAVKLVQVARKFDSDAILEYNGKTINLKSIMCLMFLDIPKGAVVKIITNGLGATDAIVALEEIMKRECLAV
ncbi:TPA: HPr family phosphocarrier protein [Bacillus cereus]|nr:HPr family phosphocarrier protein [Bacillus cereus]